MIRLASPMATAELQTRGPLYKPATPVQRKEQEGIGSQIAGKVTEKVIEKGLEELAAKTALTAVGTAVGGPVGGMVGSAVGEVAGPTIASLLKGMFFNKGGYINGPLAPAYNKGGPVNKSLPISPKQMLEKKLNEEYKFAADLGMVRDDEARARKEEFEKTILGKLFGGGSGKDISGRIAARELAAEQVQKQYPALMKRLYGSRSK